MEKNTQYIRKDDHYLDTKTGLKWSLENFGPMTWDEAMQQYPQNGEWRLPTVKELLTLIDYKLTGPATELPGMRRSYYSSYYWTSNDLASYTDYAWGVYLYYGYGDHSNKCESRYVRAVRGEMK